MSFHHTHIVSALPQRSLLFSLLQQKATYPTLPWLEELAVNLSSHFASIYDGSGVCVGGGGALHVFTLGAGLTMMVEASCWQADPGDSFS